METQRRKFIVKGRSGLFKNRHMAASTRDTYLVRSTLFEILIVVAHGLLEMVSACSTISPYRVFFRLQFLHASLLNLWNSLGGIYIGYMHP